MKRKHGIILAVVVGVLALAALGRVMLVGSAGKSGSPEHRAMLRARLSDTEPQVRAAAAAELRKARPDDHEITLALAQAQVELRRLREARELMQALLQNATALDEPSRSQALLLLADTYLFDSDSLLERAGSGSVIVIDQQVRELLDQAQEVIFQVRLLSEESARRTAALLEARVLDQRAALLRFKLRGQLIELAKARALDFQEEIQSLGGQAQELEAQLEQTQSRIESLCRQRLAVEPRDNAPYVLLVRSWLRQARPAMDRVYEAVQGLADQPTLDRASAGHVAKRLLMIEQDLGLPMTGRELELARKLLEHRHLIGRQDLDFRLALALLALRSGDPAGAQARAIDILKDYSSHPGATCLLAEALIDLDRPDEALAVLAPLNDRVQLAVVQYTLGKVYLADRQDQRAAEALRRSVDAQPDNLPARILLVKMLMDQGRMFDAGPDLVAAAAINPEHPDVLALQARQLIDRMDSAGLAQWMRQHGLDPDRRDQTLDWPDVAVVAAMVLDDTSQVADLLAGRTLPRGLRTIAQAWLQTPPQRRGLVAAMIGREVLDWVDNQPLEHPLEPWASLDIGEPLTQPPPIAALLTTRFVPWPEATALALVRCGLRRWPDEPILARQARDLGRWLGHADDAVMEPDGSTPVMMLARVRGSLVAGDFPAVVTALEDLLREHPWSELALLLTLRDRLEASAEQEVKSLLELADRINPELAVLAQSRVFLVQRQPELALTAIERLQNESVLGTDVPELMYRAAEVRCRANLLRGRMELAYGEFQNLALQLPHHKMEMQLRSAQVLLATGRQREALAAVASVLADASSQDAHPMALDRALACALDIMPGERLLNLIDAMLKHQPDDPLLLLYRARSLCKTEAPDAGEEALRITESVLDRLPDSPRALMTRGLVLEARGRTGEAREHYERLARRGGELGRAAGERARALVVEATP